MTERVVKATVSLDPSRHQPTGRTRHFADGIEQPHPEQLRIDEWPIPGGDSEVYLLYLDAKGAEQNDTLHRSVADAMAQAQSEFNVEPGEWERMSD